MRPGTGKSGRVGVLPYGSGTAQLLLALALFAPVCTLSAGTVSSCDEASLRAAMSGGGVVTFACSGTITLSSTLVIATHTVLDASAHSITISGNGNVRVFYVNPGVSLVLSNLTIAGGRAPGTDSFDPRYGPGLFNDGGNVVIAGCTFSGNKALSVSWHGSGGAIYNASGTLNVSSSTFVGNVASGEGAWRAMGRGGAIFIEMGTASLINCTFFRNTARTYSADWRMTGSYGGAVFNDQGQLWITNCTFAENRADGQSYSFGGHLWSTGSVTLVNCILAYSLMGGNGATNFIDAGHNISSDNSCAFLAPGSLNNVDVKLGPLASNGGPTMTIMPLNGSPAIDAGDEAACPSQDQRGIARLIGGACDIGAVETPSGVFRFSSPLYTGWEAVGVVSITVERLDYFQRQISVDFRTGTGNLAPGLDYVATNGTLVFQANELCKSFDVQVLADSVPEVSESVSLVLSDPVGGELGTPSLATLTILDGGLPTNLCSEVGLAAALSVGGLIQFDCDATIMLADTLVCAKDAVLDARNHRVTLSGNNSVRVLEVCSGVNLSLLNITIADGRSSDGGGVYNSGGRLTMVNCTFTNNHAVGLPGANGTNGLSVAPGICLEVGEDGTLGESGQVARGGAVFNAGTVIATNTVFVGNTAEGGAGGSGGAGGQGGRCIDQFGRCVFEVRGGTGGDGAPAGGASGGAIFNLGSTVLENVTIRDNRTLGGRSGAGGAAGPAGCGAYIGAHPGVSAVGGASQGGGIYNEGSLLLSAVSLFGNAAHGGAGGKGADESPGRYATPGAMGGRGVGGAIANFGTNTMVNVTLALNRTIGGDGGLGGFKYGCPIERNGNGGDGIGGGVFNSGRFSATNCTIWANDSAGGLATNLPAGCTVRRDGLRGTGFAASIQNTGGVATLVNSILGNPASSSNCVGVIIDLGHNICSDASAAFTAPASLNSTDPKLGPLADNGGTTRTISLESGSPAIDAADNGQCPPTDQRGVSRPVGVACDIGAFEGSDGFHYPTLSQTFTPSLILTGTLATLRFTLSNTSSRTWSNITFTNQLPAQVLVAQDSNLHFDCGGAVFASNGTITVSGVSLTPNHSCSVTVDVTCLTVGTYTNFVNPLYSLETVPVPAGAPTVLVVVAPPSVTTGAASGQTLTSAVLNGLVNPNGSATVAYFEFGPTTNYADRTSAQVVGSAWSLVPFSTAVSGLSPATVYHCRAAASNSFGIVYGADAVFYTSGLPPAGNALRLDGMDDYVITPHLRNSFSDETVTIELWLRPFAPGVIIDERGYVPGVEVWYNSQMELLASGEIMIRVWNLPSMSLGSVAFGDWHHAVLRYDKATTNLDGFLDGTEATTDVKGDRAAPWESGHRILYAFGLGDTANLGSGRFLASEIDEVRIWNTARSNPEICANRFRRLTGLELGLVCYWRFDEGSGPVALDSSSFGNHGNLINSPQRVPSTTPVADPLRILRLTSGQIRIDAIVCPLSFNVLEASTNLVNWTSLATNQATAGALVEILDPEPALRPWRFYRVRPQ